MEIKEIENRIMNFANKRSKSKNYDLSKDLVFIHLTEELGELAKQFVNFKMKPEKYDEENLKEEIIDVLLETIVLGNLCKVDFDLEIEKKINRLYEKFGFKE